MTPTELDALALEIGTKTDEYFADPEQSPSDTWLKNFARRYRAALIEKMEPDRLRDAPFDLTPLYSLEDWKP